MVNLTPSKNLPKLKLIHNLKFDIEKLPQEKQGRLKTCMGPRLMSVTGGAPCA